MASLLHHLLIHHFVCSTGPHLRTTSPRSKEKRAYAVKRYNKNEQTGKKCKCAFSADIIALFLSYICLLFLKGDTHKSKFWRPRARVFAYFKSLSSDGTPFEIWKTIKSCLWIRGHACNVFQRILTFEIMSLLQKNFSRRIAECILLL